MPMSAGYDIIPVSPGRVGKPGTRAAAELDMLQAYAGYYGTDADT